MPPLDLSVVLVFENAVDKAADRVAGRRAVVDTVAADMAVADTAAADKAVVDTAAADTVAVAWFDELVVEKHD